ncbi:MAG: M23 family metallopeptidase [Patescibacteria group bacterium]
MATTVFEQPSTLLNSSALSTYIDELEKHKVDFDPLSLETVLALPEFPDFLDEIVDTLDELVSSKVNQTIPTRFNSIFTASEAAEDKNQVRYFLNLIFTEVNRKNPKVFEKMPLFFLPNDEKSESDILNRDEYVRRYLLKENNALQLLRSISEDLIARKISGEAAPDEAQANEEKTKDKSEKEVDGSYVGGGAFRKSQTEQTPAENDAQNVPRTDEQTPPSPFEVQKIAAQEGWRDSGALMNEVLNSALDVADWRTFYNKLPADEQRQLDFQLFSLQEDIAGVISLYLQENPQFALLLAESGRLSITDRITIRQQLLSHVDQIYKRLCNNEYFLLKTEILKEKFELKAFNDTSFKGSLKTAEDATQLFSEKIDSEDAPQDYSELAKQEFKKQLKQIATFEAMVSAESIENLGDEILRRAPRTKGTGISALDPLELRQIFPENIFSLGADERKKLLGQIDVYLKQLQTNGKTVTQANFENFAKFQRFSKDNPKEALVSLLRTYNKDGSAEINILNTLDSYALSLGSPHLLSDNLKVMLNELDPSLRNNQEVLQIMESYVAQRKHALANYTQNNLLTHSLEPGETTPLSLSTEQYRELIKTYSPKYKANTDKVLAHAFFTRDLAITPAEASEQEKFLRAEALYVRNQYLNQLQAQINNLDEQEQVFYSNMLGVDRQQFLPAGQTQLDNQGRAAFNKALYDTAVPHQSWNAPQVGNVQGLSNLRDWLGRAKGIGNLNAASLQGTATKIGSSQLKKGVLVVGGAAGTGAAIYGIITNMVQGVAGTTLGGVAGGAVAGGIIGSFFPVVGTAIGASVGAIAGGIAGFMKGASDAGSTSSYASALPSSTKAALSNFARPAVSTAAGQTTGFLEGAAQTLTAQGITGSTATIAAAVGIPLVTIVIANIFTTSMILSAFLPDASVTQVAPYFSLDADESRYITLKKTAQPSNSNAQGPITYTIDLSKKPEATEEIVITGLTDTMSAIDKDSNVIDPPALPQELTDQLAALAGQPLTADQPIHLQFTVDASDSRFSDSLVKNDIKANITAAGQADSSTSRAQTCFGDCPTTTVPPCWPVKGRVTQLPYGTGPISHPVLTQQCITHPSWSHCGGFKVRPDAYDIAAPLNTPIYAAAPGVVTVVTTKRDNNAFGNLLVIDHGGWLSYYAHQIDGGIVVHVGETVEGGQLVGHVDSTHGPGGASDGNHLHYEIRGLSDYALIQTLGVSTAGKVPEGPRCDEYYGK